MRLAEEYDAAQERGEVGQRTGRPKKDVADDNDFLPATAADLGLRRDEIHEARKFHNAEKESPGIGNAPPRRDLLPQTLPGEEKAPFWRGCSSSKPLFYLVEPRGIEPLTS